MKKTLQICRTILPLILFSAASASAEPTVLKRPPESAVRAKTALNLARAYLGADIDLADGSTTKGIDPGIHSNDPNHGVHALISDDETIGFPVEAGSTRLIVTLPRPSLLSSIEISGFTVAGKLNAWVAPVKMAAEDSRWRQVVKEKTIKENRPLFAKFGSADAAYVMLEFVTSQPGRVGALGIYGDTKISDVTIRTKDHPRDVQPEMGEVVDFNYANLVAGGEVAYTSSARGGSEAARMIDDVPDTDYKFATSDPAPITVVQLDAERPVRRVSVSYEAEKPGKMEFYLMKGVPGEPIREQTKADQSEWTRASYRPVPRFIAAQLNVPQLIKVDPSYFEENKPTGVVDTEVGKRRVAFECSAVDSSFLMVRWVPADGSSAGNFAISEINVFGNTRKEDVEPAWDEPAAPGEGGGQTPGGMPGVPPAGFTSFDNSMEPPELPTVSAP